MRALRPQQLDLIDALVAQTPFGGITAGLLEKDEVFARLVKAYEQLALAEAEFVGKK